MPGRPALLDRSTIRVLVITGDPATAARLADTVRLGGYLAERAHDSRDGLARALTRMHDVVVIDRELAPESGLHLLRRLRRAQLTTPVVMLMPPGAPADQLACLRLGAAACHDKRVAPEELRARLRALCRRSPFRAGVMQLGAAQVDLTRRVVTCVDGRHVQLTRQETALLSVLGAAQSQVVSRARLNALVFPDRHAKSIVDTYVYYLRRKLGRDVVQTVRSVGYRLGSVPFRDPEPLREPA
ncbi:response regulator transcription factor [Amycolatopsis sp. cg5]|uniref:response regulator transcription factor n=1 Tax=Amycolatopsis sp. cg5 TaxID=3238802 RepID=UPI003523CB2C